MARRKPPQRKTPARKSNRSDEPLLPRWLIITVVCVVLVVWVVSLYFSAVNPTKWPVPAQVHGAAIAVITAVLGYITVAATKRNNDGK